MREERTISDSRPVLTQGAPIKPLIVVIIGLYPVCRWYSESRKRRRVNGLVIYNLNLFSGWTYYFGLFLKLTNLGRTSSSKSIKRSSTC
jgi:hypothetical protein